MLTVASQRTDPDGPGTDVILLTAASVVLLTIGVASTSWWVAGRPDDEWPAWIEAGATVAAVGAAIVAGFYAARAFGLEHQREARWEDQQSSAQAALVAAWPGNFSVDGGGSNSYGGTSGPPRLTHVRVHIRNASSAPVTQVWVDATLVVDQPDGQRRIHFARHQVARVLAPESEPDAPWVEGDQHVDLTQFVGGMEADYWAEVAITFRDAGGRDWKRLAEGQLVLEKDAAL